MLRRARERGAARRASKGLDALGPAMLAVADQHMEVSVSVSKVLTLRVRTSEARGLYAFGGTRRLFTSLHGRTGKGAGTTADEGVEVRRQAGQSSGQRGLS